MDGFRPALGFDRHLDCNRRPAELHHADQAPDDVADQHRVFELDAVEGHCHQYWHWSARGDDEVPRPGVRGHVDVAEDDASEDRALRVKVRGHHDRLQGHIRLVGHRHNFSSFRTIITPSTMFVSLRQAIARAVCEKPQSGVTCSRSGSTYFSTSRSLSATSSGGSTQVFFTSTRPTATDIGGLIWPNNSTSAI